MICKECIWYNNLRHNKGTAHGFRSSHCCTMEFESTGGDIVQVNPNGYCGFFQSVDGRDDMDCRILRQEDPHIVYCGECKHMYCAVEDGTRKYYCKKTEQLVSPASHYCGYGTTCNGTKNRKE